MKIKRSILLGSVCACTLAEAGFFHGSVRKSRFGTGIDSVRITLNGSELMGFTDSAGGFNLVPSTSVHPRASAGAEVIWRRGTRAIEWSGLTGPIAIVVSDARGRAALRHSAPGLPGGGRFRAAPLPQGIHFAHVRAGGKTLTWKWYESEEAGGGAGPAMADSRDAAFPLQARMGAAAKASAADSLVFEKKGFVRLAMAVDGSQSGMTVRLVRRPIKLLIVDGMSNHEWRQTTRIVRAIYAKAGFFSVDVSTAPDKSDAAAWRAWQPRFGDYEVVVLNYNSGHVPGSLRWPAEMEARLETFVRDGGGLYALHSANNSFPQWVEYNRMIGTGWRSKDFGFALQVETDGAVARISPGTGGATTHGNRADVQVHLLGAHPIHKGYPAVFAASSLEIYQYARGPAQDCEVLSYAYDGPASGGSNRNWPIELMVSYGKGKVYNSTMGHVWAGETLPDGVRDVAFQTALIRAGEWLARREVLYPVPAVFNSASKVEYADLTLP